ncbi:hypothetical protein AAMO2058_000253300 [Amorphochlora amoebiformis]
MDAGAIRSLVESWVTESKDSFAEEDEYESLTYDGRPERLGLGAKPGVRKTKEESTHDRRIAGRLLKKRKNRDDEEEEEEKDKGKDDSDDDVEEEGKLHATDRVQKGKKAGDYSSFFAKLQAQQTQVKKKRKRRKKKKKAAKANANNASNGATSGH